MITAEEIAAKVGALPPLPGTALRLVTVINDPSSTVDDVVEAVRYDQAVTAEVLRLCNSAYFGLSRKITSLHDATVCLGLLKVLQLVMAVHANALLSKEQSGYGLEPGVLWRHSVGVAMASSAIAERIRLPSPGLVFTAGLLHDIGKVVLNEYVADKFAEIVALVAKNRMSFEEAEQNVLGFSHATVGSMVAENWKLPEALVRCIRYQHSPSSLDPPDAHVDTIHLADCICMLLGVGLGEDGLAYRADHAAMARCGLGEQDLETIGIGMMTELKKVEQVFAEARPSQSRKEQPVG